MKKILVVSSNPERGFESIRESFKNQAEVIHSSSRDEALALLGSHRFDLVFLDIHVLTEEAQPTDDQIRQSFLSFSRLQEDTQFIVMAPSEAMKQVGFLMSLGMADYLQYPITQSEVRIVSDRLQKIESQHAELKYLRKEVFDQTPIPWKGSSSALADPTLEKIKSISQTKTTVLLYGETGVGKGHFSKLIHEMSSRRNHPFIHVHCGAIPDTLFESELFGHEMGSFTGAFKKKLGCFELAHKGTLFLDEVSTLSSAAQIKLLNVLQSGAFYRVGGEKQIEVDVRVIAATNEFLKDRVEQGTFRQDLYYRLNVFPIEIPPLRNRKGQIAALVQNTIEKLNQSLHKEIKGIDSKAAAILKSYTWPGNIRELENIIERACILEKTDMITLSSLPQELVENSSDSALFSLNSELPLPEARNRMIESFERQYLSKLLAEFHGDITEVAKIAGLGVRQINKMIHKYGFNRSDYKSIQKKDI